jgi:hypothetical protein
LENPQRDHRIHLFLTIFSHPTIIRSTLIIPSVVGPTTRAGGLGLAQYSYHFDGTTKATRPVCQERSMIPPSKQLLSSRRTPNQKKHQYHYSMPSDVPAFLQRPILQIPYKVSIPSLPLTVIPGPRPPSPMITPSRRPITTPIQRRRIIRRARLQPNRRIRIQMPHDPLQTRGDSALMLLKRTCPGSRAS